MSYDPKKFVSFSNAKNIIAIEIINHKDFKSWNAKQSIQVKNWLKTNDFKAKSRSFCLMPNVKGGLQQVFLGVDDYGDFNAISTLANNLPDGTYEIVTKLSDDRLAQFAFAWMLNHYKFDKYKKAHQKNVKLFLPRKKVIQEQVKIVEAFSLVMDMVNTPAEDMYPEILSKQAKKVAQKYNATFKEIVGDALLKNNLPAIHAVGRSSYRKPRLVEINWGKKSDPELVLLGKGVCFDSGGFDLKSTPGMADMKTDMGGAAHALALAQLVMEFKLPVNLRVLLPAVENLIDSRSYKPGDVIKTRSGVTVEITNTDAEGRMILSDSLALACEGKPDLMIDFATLTGAAKVGLGMDVPVFFTDDEKIANDLTLFGQKVNEPIWRLPIYKPYMHYMESKIADVRNAASTRWGGAITAALFLQKFVKPKVRWVHFDIAAMSLLPKSGRPRGAGVDALRTLLSYLRDEYKK